MPASPYPDPNVAAATGWRHGSGPAPNLRRSGVDLASLAPPPSIERRAPPHVPSVLLSMGPHYGAMVLSIAAEFGTAWPATITAKAPSVFSSIARLLFVRVYK